MRSASILRTAEDSMAQVLAIFRLMEASLEPQMSFLSKCFKWRLPSSVGWVCRMFRDLKSVGLAVQVQSEQDFGCEGQSLSILYVVRSPSRPDKMVRFHCLS